MLPSSAQPSPHQPPHLSWEGWLTPQKGTEKVRLCQRTHPGLWRGLALDTDTACDQRESPFYCNTFWTLLVSLEKARCCCPLPVAGLGTSCQLQVSLSLLNSLFIRMQTL